jgi:glycosyltransferase involved in cell wall biosynthesis
VLQRQHRALYAAFDRFPSRKGAAMHIDRFARALFDFADGGLLYVLGADDLPAQQVEGNVEIVRFCTPIDNFLERTIAFGERLDALLDEISDNLKIAHFRDPWSGLPIVSRPHSHASVYEVNALPSVELPYAYPSVAPATLEKIERLEQIVLEKADAVVVPAATIREHLLHRGVPAEKVTVIPNGADLSQPVGRPEDAPSDYILYFGALQEWQGIEILFRAFARLRDLESLHLVVCSSHDTRYAKAYVRLAEKLEIADRLIWKSALGPNELQPWLQHAIASVAPLTDSARNVVQGCSPLKILESMAAGVPVIASDLAAVRELITDRVEGLLVPPDRPAALARAIRILFEYPDMRRSLATRAKDRVARAFTWTHSTKRLQDVYATLARSEVHA